MPFGIGCENLKIIMGRTKFEGFEHSQLSVDGGAIYFVARPTKSKVT
jgi:hypothetical protein